MDSNRDYVLITPARNEESYIEKPLEAVVAQTILPKRWIIVSDGSTDRTDEIVQSYADRFDFITLVRRDKEDRRSFGSKALAFNSGLEAVRDLDFDFLGNLDADISFDPDYYQRVMDRLFADPDLGATSGVVFNLERGRFVRAVSNTVNHAAGAVQFFRRECLEQIGGYTPLKHGGEDSVAIVYARMNGWAVRSFEDIVVRHHRPEGHHANGCLRSQFQDGRREYALGTHPVFAILKAIRRFQEYPFVLGGIVRLAGFLWPMLSGEKREITEKHIQFIRADQKKRMKALIWPFGRKNAERG